MRLASTTVRFGTLVTIVSFAALAAIAQDKKDWVRVKTGGDSIIHVDETSLEFGLGGSGYSADFRTTLSEPEPVPTRAGLKYKARIDRIEFGQGYRILSTRFLDGHGAVIHTVEFDANSPWRTSFGSTANAMASVIRKLNPFGTWEVMEYRYASGEKSSPDDDRELRELPGSKLRFEPDGAMVGGKTYSIRSLEGKTVSNDDAKKYFDTSLASLGIEGDNLSAVRFTVVDGGHQSFLLRVNPERAIMLWEGVFLELRRVPSEF